MPYSEILAKKVLNGEKITIDEAMNLYSEPLEILCEKANEIREKFCADKFDVCTIINAKSGRCSENCKFRNSKDAGISRVHNNLETSENFFPKVCTTHKFTDKIQAIKSAQNVGLQVCSGGIMRIGESIEDRISMAFSLRELGIKSVPVNMLNPIAGTPLALNQILEENELRRIIAVYRFILPDVFIRLAGGRGLLKDHGESCFKSGANASISGDMLTTAGYSVESDMKLFRELGFNTKYHK